LTALSAIKVMTWNIHGGMGPDGLHDLDRMITLVRQVDPDVLALQEVDARRQSGAEHPLSLLKRVLGLHGVAAAAIVTPDGAPIVAPGTDPAAPDPAPEAPDGPPPYATLADQSSRPPDGEPATDAADPVVDAGDRGDAS